MRKLAALSLLLLVLMGTFGTAASWLVVWRQARREGKARLKATAPAADRVTIRLTQAQLAAARVDDHEVRLQGHMYDILQEELLLDGSIQLVLLPDHAEDRLFAHLDQLVAGILASKAGQQGKQVHGKIGLPVCCLPSPLLLTPPLDKIAMYATAASNPQAGYAGLSEHPPQS